MAKFAHADIYRHLMYSVESDNPPYFIKYKNDENGLLDLVDETQNNLTSAIKRAKRNAETYSIKVDKVEDVVSADQVGVDHIIENPVASVNIDDVIKLILNHPLPYIKLPIGVDLTKKFDISCTITEQDICDLVKEIHNNIKCSTELYISKKGNLKLLVY